MGRILCFVTADMADFEVTLALHMLSNLGQREIIPVGYDLAPVLTQAGLTQLPQQTLRQAAALEDVEALILPGGPIRPQGDDLTSLIQQLDREKKLLAAICFGPQYLGRAGVLDRHRFTTSCSVDTIRALQVPDPYPRHNSVDERVVRDGHVITARGSAFVDFAFAIAEALGVYAGRQAEKERLYKEMMDR